MFAFETDYYACQHYFLLQQMQASPYPVLAFPQLSPQQFHPTSTNQLFFTHSFQNYTNPVLDRPDSPQASPTQRKESGGGAQIAKGGAEAYEQFSKTSEGAAKAGKQKFGRNINSNIFHLMVKFVRKERAVKAKVSKIIQLNKMALRPSEFYQIFKNKSYKLKSYATHDKIMEFWGGPHPQDGDCPPKCQRQLQAARVFRILGRLYLREQHLPYLFNSVKIKAASRALHLHALRRFAAQ